MSSAKLDITETGFEGLIAKDLIESRGWQLGHSRMYDKVLGLYPTDATDFVKSTQPDAWRKLVEFAGGDQPATDSLLRRLAGQLTKRGTVDVLRNGISEKN